MKTWKELKDRRLVQILLAYLAGGWLCLEGLGLLIEQGVVPGIAFQIGLVAYIVGIPVSAILGWFHGEKGDQKVSVLEVGLLTLVIASGSVGGFLVVDDWTGAEATTAGDLDSTLDLRRLAVLYFEDESGGDLTHLADGFTESLIEQLDAVRELEVASPNAVRPFRHGEVTVDSVARALDAGTVIDGSVEPLRRSADGDPTQIRVTTRLYDGESGARIRQSVFEVSVQDLLAARDSLGRETALALRRWLGEEVELRELQRGTENLAAWTLHQRENRALKDADQAVAGGDAESADAAFRRADSLYALAARSDTAWAEPLIQRGWAAYRRSRAARDLDEISPAVDAGLEHAAAALARASSASDPVRARALELRGTLRYWKYQLPITHDAAARRALLSSAVEDLESATEQEPGLAHAHSVLSHYYYTQSDLPGVLLAARTAYREDAYVDDADQVLWRLFLANYDLGQFNRARNWCEEGRSRFPRHAQLALCRLYLLTAPTVEPDVDEAWSAFARVDSLLPAEQPSPFRHLAQLLVGAVLGRAELEDSARSVLVDARLPSELRDLDPNLELTAFEAFARTRFGDFDTAIDLMKRYVAANHGFERGGVQHWWWDELREHPRFPELETATP